MRGFGDITNNALVASICARNVGDPNAQDFGYDAALAGIADRLTEKPSGRCFAQTGRRGRGDGRASRGKPRCTLIEAAPCANRCDAKPCASQCACDPSDGRTTLSAKLASEVRERLRDYGECSDAESCNALCLWELLPVGGEIQDGEVSLPRSGYSLL